VESGYEVLKEDAARALRQLEARNITANFVFLDPPYRLEKVYAQILQQLSQSTLLAPDAVVFAEHDKRFDPGADFSPLFRYRKLEQGDAALSFYRTK
jgi:16S rRNA G966 N2-methylase RsmD